MPELLEQATDLSPEAVCRRWKLELKLSSKREDKWRKKAKDVCKAYTPETPALNSFNVLWTNTETLRQACYNSLPQPIVRRRYHDDDPVGKAVSKVLQRALEFCQDEYDFDAVIKGDVLAMLLPGRAVSRIRYVPSLSQVGADNLPGELTHSEGSEEPTHEAQEGAYEELTWEQVVVERVQWADFRMGAGKTWDEVQWVAFRHDLTRDDLIEKFGEQVGKSVGLDGVAEEDFAKNEDLLPLFRTAEVWEIWDKDKRQVVWIANGFDRPLKVQSDPLGLKQFFPNPRPLYAIEQHDSLEPVPLYSQYEQQAKELNRISQRINKLVEALRVRGIYDATLTEISELMRAGDNELIPAQNVTALLERGGLEKAIWMVPMETAAAVLAQLYVQRDATKQVIYEITGIADIMRAASDPAETFGAQKIKTTWGTQRLQRMQGEVQRYIRDILRLKAELIAEKFQPQTIAAMTMLELPTEADAAMAAQQAAQAGQQPAPMVTWEQVIQALRDEAGRSYRIDIETDSTLTATQDNDMQALTELLGGVTALVQGLGPAVQAGAMPVEAIKEIILVACRRAKLGTAVEDALEAVQAPAPAADPAEAMRAAEEAKAQAAFQLEQFKAQVQSQQHERELAATAQLEQFKAQLSAQMEEAKQAAQARQAQQETELEAERERLRIELESAASDRSQAFEKWKAELDASTRIVIAEMAAGREPTGAGVPTISSVIGGGVSEAVRAANAEVIEKLTNPVMQMQAETIGAIRELVAGMNRPKRIVRGMDGKAVGVE
jgi:hypothetical protein